MSTKAYGSLTVTDLLDTATYIYYSATGSNSVAGNWHITPAVGDLYIGIYSGPPFDGGQPATPADFMSSLLISKYVGEDGARGGLILNITTAPTAYTTKEGDFTPAYRIAKSTVLTQSGASDVQVGDTLAYSYYHYQVGYVDSSYVYLGAAKNIRGETGAAAIRYSLIVSPSIVVKNQNGSYDSSSIVLTAKSKQGTSAEAAYSGYFKIEKTTDGSTWTNVYTSTANQSTYTLSTIPTDIKSLRCSLYLADGTTTLLDQQTIPIVTDGIDATQYYTYVRYSANSDGSSYTDTPSSSTKYIGVCVSTSSIVPAYNDSAWKWSKYIGENGTSATQYYTYVRYSANSNGSSYVDTPTTSTKYIGVCVTTATSAPAYNNSAWKWSLYVGNDAYTVLLTNESHSFLEGETESTLCGVVTYKGATQVSCYVGDTTSTTSINTNITGLTCMVANNNSTNVQLTFGATASLVTNSGVVSIPIHVDGKTFTKNFSFSLALKGDTGVSIINVTPLYYAKANSTAPGKPTSVINITSTTGGQWTKGIPELTSTYPYMFTCEQVQYDSTSVGTNGYTWTDPVLNNMITKFVETYNSFVAGDTTWKSTYGTKITTIEDTVNNLQVGGRNLVGRTYDYSGKSQNEAGSIDIYANDAITGYTYEILDDTNFKTKVFHATITSEYTFSTYRDSLIKNNMIKLEPDTDYIFSYYAKGTGTIHNYLYPDAIANITTSWGYNGTGSDGYASNQLTSNWEKYWVKWHTLSTVDTTTYKSFIAARLSKPSSDSQDFYIAEIKLEKGNVATDWTSAPEDIDDTIVESTQLWYSTEAVSNTLTGDIVSFDDPEDERAIKSLTAEINAVQSGSGDPSPTNVRPISGWDAVNIVDCGKNLAENVDAWNIDATGMIITNSSYKCSVVRILIGQTYIHSLNGASANISVIAYYADRPTMGSTAYDNTRHLNLGTAIFTAPITGYAVIRDEISATNIQVELNSTATAYEPYNGTTTTISLPSTCYGGTLDVINGVLTITYDIVDLGTLTWIVVNGGADPSKKRMVSNSLNGIAYNTANDIISPCICTKYIAQKPNDSYANSVPYGIAISPSGTLYINDPNYESATDATTFKTAMNGVYLIYGLATPITVQLTPIQVVAVLEQNNIWADSGIVTVSYTSVPDPPAAPTAHVTNIDTASNNWTKSVPEYNSNSPYLYYCYEYLKNDNTYMWSDVVLNNSVTGGIKTLDDNVTDINNRIGAVNQQIQTIKNEYSTIEQTSRAITSTVGTLEQRIYGDGTESNLGDFSRLQTSIEQTADKISFITEDNQGQYAKMGSTFSFSGNTFSIDTEGSEIKSEQGADFYRYVEKAGDGTNALFKITKEGTTSSQSNVTGQIGIGAGTVNQYQEQWAIRKGAEVSGVGYNLDFVWVGGN